jgi:hypothetical protein
MQESRMHKLKVPPYSENSACVATEAFLGGEFIFRPTHRQQCPGQNLESSVGSCRFFTRLTYSQGCLKCKAYTARRRIDCKFIAELGSCSHHMP